MKKLILLALFAFIKVDAQIITTVAGNGTSGFSGDGGQATAAELYYPTQIILNASGDIFISDAGNGRIRKLNTNGIISEVAGNGTSTFNGDGIQATIAGLTPSNLAFDAIGNLYVSETSNQRVRKIDASGIITTVAGSGNGGFIGDGGQATNAYLSAPSGITFDANGNLYIAEINNGRVRMVNSSGIITTFAGNGGAGTPNGDGGQATAGELCSPNGVTFDASGNLYIADYCGAIRKVNPSGIISTVAGTGTSGYSGDGGQATNAQLQMPNKIIFDATGNMYIPDAANNRIRKVSTTGIITTIVGTGTAAYNGDGIMANLAELNGPCGLAFDVSGNLFIVDEMNERIRKVTNVAVAGIKPITANNDEVTLYPNPASDIINIELKPQNETQNTVVSIYYMLGACVYKQTTSVANNQINIADLTPGVYTVEITTANQKIVKRLVKQ